jgi:hypothetical protein
MSKRRFEVDFNEYTAVIELDSAVIDAVTDEWRTVFYPSLKTAEDIAEHVAYNMIVNDAKLSQLDGWADQPDSNAKIIVWPGLDNWDTEAREIT